MNEGMREVAGLMAHAQRPTVLTGAGISAESGIPTFRGSGGFWKDEEEMMRLSTLEGFLRNPQAVWEFYDRRRVQANSVQPNPGHKALADWEHRAQLRGRDFALITQNIDGLHARAGSRNILELHGSIWQARCFKGCSPELVLLPKEPLPAYPPECPKCGAMLRPHIVWFGEKLHPAILEESFALAEESDFMLVVGTSGQVYPAAGLPHAVKQGGGVVVQVNMEPTELSATADYNIYGKSGEILPELMMFVQLGDKL